MTEEQLADVLLAPIACADCEAAHASGGPQGCPFITEATAGGTVIYQQGALADRVWLVRSGVVELASPDSSTTVLKGGLIGLDCLVSRSRLSTARADTATQLCSISKRALVHWLGDDARRLKLILDAAMDDPSLVDALDQIEQTR